MTKITLIVCVFLWGISSSFAQKQKGYGTANSLTAASISIIADDIDFSEPYVFELQKNGLLQHTDASNISFTANIKNRRLHGKWESRNANNQLIDKGSFVKGVPDGEWKVWDAKGNLLAIRHYSADLLQRVKQEVLLNHPHNSYYSITALYKKNGASVARFLKASYSFGQKQQLQTNSLTALVERNASDATAYHPPFLTCLHHGLYTNYYSNGHVKDSGYYKEGLREGLWIHYTAPGGSYWKGFYHNGSQQKEWKLYNEKGKLLLIVFYSQNGEEIWRKEMGD